MSTNKLNSINKLFVLKSRIQVVRFVSIAGFRVWSGKGVLGRMEKDELMGKYYIM